MHVATTAQQTLTPLLHAYGPLLGAGGDRHGGQDAPGRGVCPQVSGQEQVLSHEVPALSHEVPALSHGAVARPLTASSLFLDQHVYVGPIAIPGTTRTYPVSVPLLVPRIHIWYHIGSGQQAGF